MNFKKLIGPFKIIVVFLMILLGILAAYSIYSLMYELLTGSKYAYIMNYSTHEVNETNMSPDYNIGDLIILKKNNTYKIGDVVLYNFHGSYRLGKINDYKNNAYVLTDNIDSVSDDYKVTSEMIVGFVTNNLIGFGTIYSIITGPLSIIFFIVTIAGYFFLTLGERG